MKTIHKFTNSTIIEQSERHEESSVVQLDRRRAVQRKFDSINAFQTIGADKKKPPMALKKKLRM